MSTRKLTTWEMAKFYPIFGSNIKFGDIVVHESSPIPNLIDRIGSFFTGKEPYANNAITIGNNVMFPMPIGTDRAYWLIHEVTHAWQYQHIGWKYLWDAIVAQFRGKPYDYGGEDGLNSHTSIYEFNPEQQAQIVQDYYIRVENGVNADAWKPYIEEIKNG